MRARPASARGRRRRDPLAVASLVFAILWVFGVGSLAAIALGYAALRRGPSEDRTLALAGIGLGAVGLVIAVVFLARNAAPG